MRIDNLPVGRSVPIASAIDGFIAGNGQYTGVRARIRHRVVDCHVHEFVIWGPERVGCCRRTADQRHWAAVLSRKHCQREQTEPTRETVAERRTEDGSQGATRSNAETTD